MGRAMITIYGRADSSNVQAVSWGAAELGLEVERLDFGHRFGGTDTPEFRAMNPLGLVPVLRDGDLVMWESCAILRYLSARYGSAPFWPADPAGRAPIDQWAEWSKLIISRNFTVPIFWARVRTPAIKCDEAKLIHDISRFEADLDVLQDQIGANPFVMGRDLTLADIVAGHVLYRWFNMDIERKERPVIEQYYQRLAGRTHYQRHVMVSFDALKADGA